MIHKGSIALEQSVKHFTGGLKPVSLRQHHPKFRCGSRHIDIWFAARIYPCFVYASSEASGESAHMRICADSPEALLPADLISTEILFAGLYSLFLFVDMV